MQKGNIAILIIILAMLVVGGGAYYLGMSSKSAPVTQPAPQAINAQPTPSVSESTESADMTNWKTYTNTKLGFSIQYPSNWLVYDESTPPCTSAISGYVLINKTALKDCYTLEFKTVKEDFYIIAEDIRPLSELNLPSEPVELSGEQGIKGFVRADTEGPIRKETYVYVNHKDSTYYLSFPNSDYQGAHDSIYDQILSTFKFIP